jgi:HSP20 family protein
MIVVFGTEPANNMESEMPFNPLVPSRNRRPPSDPFALLHEIDVLFDDFGRGFFHTRPGDLVPRIDVPETDKAIEVTAEFPGLDKKDVQIEFSDDVLTIKGEKKFEKDEQEKNRRVMERRYGSFFRAIQLPSGIEPTKIEASIANGILTVKAPKPASTMRRFLSGARASPEMVMSEGRGRG